MDSIICSKVLDIECYTTVEGLAVKFGEFWKWAHNFLY